jgi:3-oxoacyl-[acyl-carrier-protein] synthase-3
MSHRIAAKITGVAGYVPPRVMTNADLEKMVATSDTWIRERTGIRERHVVENGTASSHLATEAARALLAQTKTDPAEIAGHVLSRDRLPGARAPRSKERLGL